MKVCALLVLLFSLRTGVDSNIITKSNKSCSGITIDIEDGINLQHLLLKKPAKGDDLSICRSNLTCCSKQLENGLYNQSGRLLKDTLQLRMKATQYFLATQTSKFDDYLKNLLKEARDKWHIMLLNTYNVTYQTNRHVFDTFFLSFEEYYTNGSISLKNVIRDFFKKVQYKMFVLLQPQLRKQQQFMNCTSKKFDVIKPFGDTVVRLTKQLTSTLFEARTFVQALKVASNVTSSIINTVATSGCIEGFTRIRHCSVCQGIPSALVCKKSCENLFQTCFVSATAVDKEWNDFLQSLSQLSIALEGRFNIEAVLGQLVYDISGAIMDLQINIDTVLKKAESVCKVNSGKTKRAVDSTANDMYLEGERRQKRASFTFRDLVKQHSRPRLTLDSLTKNFRAELNKVKNVWSALPSEICNGSTFVSQNLTASCWNGVGLQRNSQSVPVLKSSSIKRGSQGSILAHLLLLRMAIQKDKMGLRGGDVSSLPNLDNDDDDAGSGSGNSSDTGSASGSGSGDPDESTESSSGSGDQSGVQTTQASSNNSGSVIAKSTPWYLSSTSPSISTRPTDDDEDNIQSGSGDGNEIDDNPTTKVIGTDENSVDNDNSPTNVVILSDNLNIQGIYNVPTGDGKSIFPTSILVAYLCLIVSVLIYAF